MEVQAASCSMADVQAAADKAVSGDVVSVPAGTCAWKDALRIAGGKALTLRGAGEDATVVVDESPASLIEMATASGKPYRITGFTFRQSGIAKEGGSPKALDVFGDSHLLRIDHCRFDHSLKAQPHVRSVWFDGYVLGVIDHCELIGGGGLNGAINIYHSRWNGIGDFGDASWADDAHWGTDRFIFIEDCAFYAPDGVHFGCTDAKSGGRFVFRHCSVVNGVVNTHGTESGGRRRGVRALEAYLNTFSYPTGRANMGQIRSGSATLFDNQADGYNTLWSPVNNRSAHAFNVWGGCDGANPYDANDSRVYEEGTHDGAPSDNLVDSTKSWIDDQWAGRGLSVHNVTRNHGSYVIANTDKAIELAPSAFGGGPRFETGDEYRILKCIFAIDAVGSGKGKLLSGNPPAPEESVEQARDPLYQWNNTLNGEPFEYAEFDNPHIQLGRDVVNGPRPDYAPFAYPHPLTGEEAIAPVEPTPTPDEPVEEPVEKPTPEPEPVEEEAVKPDPPTGLRISEKGANAELMWDSSLVAIDFYRVWRTDGKGDLEPHATTAVPFFSESHAGRRGPWHYGVSVVVGGVESDIACCVVYKGK